jgi:hypothetical protein
MNTGWILRPQADHFAYRIPLSDSFDSAIKRLDDMIWSYWEICPKILLVFLLLLTRPRHESGAFEIPCLQSLVVDGRAYC